MERDAVVTALVGAEIALARDEDISAAVRIITNARAERAEAERDAMREALKQSRCQHPNRCEVYTVKKCVTLGYCDCKARAALNPSPAGREG